jgi:hypothetical protein
MVFKDQPSVAIIILNWNGLVDTIDCLNSLKEIDYQNYKVVVVDNASTDGSQELIRRNFPQHHLICNSENLGFPEGNNVAIRWALSHNYDYVLLLNNDTVVEKDFLVKLVNVCSSDRDCGIVGPNILYYSNSTKSWSLGGYFDARNRRPYQYNSLASPVNETGNIREVDWVSGCALLIKLEVIKKIGLLDPDYFFGTEDADWCARAKKFGYKIIYVHDSVVSHKKTIELLEKEYTPLELYYTMRNILIYAKKHDLFSFSFILSFMMSFAKRMLWAFTKLDIKSIKALNRALIDFKSNRFGKAHSAF